MPAVDEALARAVRAGVGVRLGDVQRQARELGRGGDAVAAVDDPRRGDAEVGEVRAGNGGPIGGEVEALDRRVQRVLGQVGGKLAEVVGVRVRGVEVVDWQHRAAPVVEDRAVLLVGRDDVQDRQAGRVTALLDRVALQRDDLGRRAQGISYRRQAAQHQAAVEEVADHALGRQRRLPDRDVADEHRVGEAATRDRLRQRRIEREAQAVADDRLMHRGVPVGQRHRRELDVLVADRHLLPVRAADMHGVVAGDRGLCSHAGTSLSAARIPPRHRVAGARRGVGGWR